MSDSVAQRSFIRSDGLLLVGEVVENGDAPTVILLHGGGQTRHSWSGTMHSLVGQGYSVINYDARGHGDSDWSRDGSYSIPSLTADLHAVCRTITGPIALVGASMGGMTSFYAVGTNPGLDIRALVMVDIVLQVAEEGGEKIRQFMTRHQDGFANIKEAADAVALYNPERPRPADPSGLRRNLRERPNGRLYWHWDPDLLGARPSAEPPSGFDDLVRISEKVTIPVLVVRGEHSDVVDDEGIAQMRQLVPQTEFYTVTGAGHMVAGDRNDPFATGMNGFLTKVLPANSTS